MGVKVPFRHQASLSVGPAKHARPRTVSATGAGCSPRGPSATFRDSVRSGLEESERHQQNSQQASRQSLGQDVKLARDLTKVAERFIMKIFIFFYYRHGGKYFGSRYFFLLRRRIFNNSAKLLKLIILLI